ncbi:MAG TPA: CDP-alcohol phosphatidyltransferase family protein [Pyrinomonadaceae bacterium]|jgi:cardiolipin synthase|nr:CDP-alcohol phosphatidyltransferase family protein [Pyrinomonadaceae bacterium]
MPSRVLTIPNILTFMRMALIPIFAILLYYQEFGWALAVFLLAGLSDGLDGFIARRFDQQSSLGLIIDPAADKLLMTTAFIALTIPGMVPSVRHLPIPFWVTALVIGRDVLIVVVAGAIHIVTGFRGFKPSLLGKISTGVQVAAIGLVLIAAAFPSINGFYLPVVYAFVGAFAFFSGMHYIFHIARLLNEDGKKS